MRYFFNKSFQWQSEFSLFLNSIIFCAAAGYTYYYNSHVRVDIIYEKFSSKHKYWFNVLGLVIFLVPMCGGIIYFSFSYISNSWRIFEASSEVGGLPIIFIFKSLIWIFPLSLLLNIKNIIKHSH